MTEIEIKYKVLNPSKFGYTQTDVDNPEFQFSLNWVDEKTIQSYLDNGDIEII